jgi:hypothetical protein
MQLMFTQCHWDTIPVQNNLSSSREPVSFTITGMILSRDALDILPHNPVFSYPVPVSDRNWLVGYPARNLATETY